MLPSHPSSGSSDRRAGPAGGPSPGLYGAYNTTSQAGPGAYPATHGARRAPTTGTSSSPPTPSPLSTSVSESRGQPQSKTSVHLIKLGAGSGGGDAAMSAANKRGGVSSASIHAAVSATTAWPAGADAGVPPPPHPPHSSLPPPPHMGGATMVDAVADEAAKEVQRQQILAHANELLTFCAIANKVTSIRQCTSSFFVLLYQRLLDCTIDGIDRSPNTAEKRRHNVTLVLEELQQFPYSLEGIAADEVVRLNEDHISRLILVFVQVAEDMRRQQEQAQMQLTAAAVSGSSHPGLGEEGMEAVPGSVGATAYVPAGYTVAEVLPGIHMHTSPPVQADQPSGSESAAGVAGNGGGYVHMDAVGRLAGGHGVGASPPHLPAHQYNDDNNHPSQEEESPSSVSYYLDSSAIPTDELLEEWYRNLVYPGAPPGKAERSTHDSRSSRDGDSAQMNTPARRPMPDSGHRGRPATERSATLSPSATPVRGSPGTRRSPGAEGGRGGAANTGNGAATHGRSRLSPHAAERLARRSPGRTAGSGAVMGDRVGVRAGRQLPVQDIVRRCQRLEEALDARESRHRTPHQITAAAAADNAALSTIVPRHADATGGFSASPVPNPHRQHQIPSVKRQSPAVAPPRPYNDKHAVQERPLTRQERDMLLRRPQHYCDAALRDRKIERLRAARYLGEMQQRLRQRMRHEYDAQMLEMRDSLRSTLQSNRIDKADLMRRVRDENKRYRVAYTTLMEAATNESQVPARVMSRYTAQLADYYATSLQHSQAMCHSLAQETERQTRTELLQYAEEVSAWQQHFLL